MKNKLFSEISLHSIFDLNKSFLLCFMKNVIRNCKGRVMASAYVSYFKQNIISKFAWNFLVIMFSIPEIF